MKVLPNIDQENQFDSLLIDEATKLEPKIELTSCC